ncbi:MAG: arylsulfatase A [Saprospiraceae bacterium]|jgi:arylsulfatase A
MLSPTNFRQPFIAIIIVLFIFTCYSCNKENKEHISPQPPNIIFILADDLGYGDISSYNAEGKIKTPNIDRMAAEGMRFTDAHSSSAVCTPTRYGILTGRYNWRSRLKSGVLTGNSKALIPNKRKTVAKMLQENNYNTAFIGKWHLGWDWALKDTSLDNGSGWNPKDFDNLDFSKPISNGPKGIGFDYSYGHAGSLDMAPYVYVENGIPTAVPTAITVDTGKYSWWREGPTSDDFVHEDVTPNFFRRSIKYISAQSKKEKPFFLYLALPSPHTPILPTKEWQGKSELNDYADFTMMIDDYIGQLESVISESGIEDNTLIIFTSDNGCSPAAGFAEMVENGHMPSREFRGHKADIFEGGHRVPYIVKWPQKISKGSLSNKTICLNDFFATCADIVNYPIADSEAEDSHSILSLLTNSNNEKEYSRDATIHHSIDGSFAIRKDEWKLIMAPSSGGWSAPTPKQAKELVDLPTVQLYNLIDDPGEKENLLAKQPAMAEILQALLTSQIINGRSTEGPHQSNDEIDGEWNQISFMK